MAEPARGSDFAPDWSPDGGRIAFSSDRLAEEEPNLEIFAMRADGSGQVNLTRHPDTDEVAVWSPNGRQLAFMSFRDASDENPFNAEIFTMNARRDEPDEPHEPPVIRLPA